MNGQTCDVDLSNLDATKYKESEFFAMRQIDLVIFACIICNK